MNDIRNPIRIRCTTPSDATSFGDEVGQRGALVKVHGRFVTIPGDQPGFLFDVLEQATHLGWVTDKDGANAIQAMETGLHTTGGQR